MKNINNIDELLKNSFNGFEATPPPNAWSGIQQGISNTPTIHSQNPISNTATVVKSATIFTKVAIVAITSGVVLGGSFIAYKYFNKTEIAETKNTIQQTQIPQIVEQKVDEKISEQNQNSKISQSKIVSPSQQNENKKVDKISDEKSTQPVVESGNKNEIINTKTSSSNQTKTVAPPVQKTEQKTALPKIKHNFPSPENNTPSTTNTSPENNYPAPKIGGSFSPNGDGINDKIEIEIENETFYSLKIYDSKNHLVFESDSKEKMWDGTKMNLGEPCEIGDYFYYFNYRYKNSEKVILMRGSIKLIR